MQCTPSLADASLLFRLMGMKAHRDESLMVCVPMSNIGHHYLGLTELLTYLQPRGNLTPKLASRKQMWTKGQTDLTLREKGAKSAVEKGA
jgi:hypothetical protein